MIDFAAIKERHPIEDFLMRRGIETKRASGGFTARCPVHDGDNKASLFIHAKKQYAHCWTRCGYIGSVLDLAMALDGVDVKAAAEILEGRTLTQEELSRPRRVRETKVQHCDDRTEARLSMPLPKLFRAEQLKEPPQHYFETIAKARGLHWAGIKMAHDAGHLRFCQPQWKYQDRVTGEVKLGSKFNCYAILDVDNPLNVQFRRLDVEASTGKALCFWGDKKVMGWRGNQGYWPVGIDSLIRHPKDTVLLVEGTGDFLAAWDMRALAMEVIPVGIFGASNSIADVVLPFFERREVVIVQQHDAACKIAAQRWQQQLLNAHARVRVWRVPEEGADLNDYISGGGDPADIAADF